MQVPFIILSYGEFKESKRIFSYERDGIHSLPIFTDTVLAINFIRSMTKILRRLDDQRILRTQLCAELKHAKDIFTVLATLAPDLRQVIINAEPPEPLDDEPDYKPDLPMEILILEDVIDKLAQKAE